MYHIVLIDGKPVFYSSLRYALSLKAEPQPFEIELSHPDQFDLVHRGSKVEIYAFDLNSQTWQKKFVGYIEEVEREVSTRGIRCVIRGRDQKLKLATHLVGEWQFLGGEPAQLVKGLLVPNLEIPNKDQWTITASKDTDNISNCIDQHPYTEWKMTSPATGDYLEITLPTAYKLCAVSIEHAPAHQLKNFKVMTWDGSNWQTVATITDNTMKNVYILWLPTYETDKVRIECTADQTEDWIIRELWLYYQFDEQIFQFGDIEEFGLMVLGQLGSFENRLASISRIASYIGWEFEVTPDGKFNFKPKIGNYNVVTCTFEEGKNIVRLRVTDDYSRTCDRLTLLGAGVGKKQLTYTVTSDNWFYDKLYDPENELTGQIYGNYKWVNSPFGWSLEFDGSSVYVDFGDILNLTGDMAIECWFRAFDKGGTAVMDLVTRASGTGWETANYRLGVGDSDGQSILIWGDGTNSESLKGSVVENKDWHFILAGFKGTDAYIYDGRDVLNSYSKATSYSHTGSGTQKLYLGFCPSGASGNYLKGNLALVKIYNGFPDEDFINQRFAQFKRMLRG